MPLIDFYTNSKKNVLEMGIKQIVAMAGDGNLKDSSAASLELREFLSFIQTKYIAQYIDTCLASSFDCSGLVHRSATAVSIEMMRPVKAGITCRVSQLLRTSDCA